MVNINQVYFFRKNSYYGLLCLLLLFFSCGQQKDNTDGYSEAFKPVFVKVTTFFGANKADSGIHYIDSALNAINKPNIDDRFRTYGFHYVYWHKFKADNKTALLYADSMLIYANKSIDQKSYVSNLVEANMALGDAYFDLQQFDNAYEHYYQGYRVGKNNLNNRALSDYDYRMGIISYKMGHYELATKYFKESYRLCSRTENAFADFYRLQELLDNIALSFKHDDNPDSAIVYFDKTIAFLNQNAPTFKDKSKMIQVALGVVYGNKAEVLILKGDELQATALLKKSIAINLQKGNDNNDAELAEIKLAEIYYNHNQNDLLLNLLNDIQLQLASVKNENVEADWNRLMSGYWLRRGDFKKSINYLHTSIKIKDSLAQKLTILKESNVNEQLDNFEKQYQIDTLKNQSKLQQIYLFVAVVCAIMAVVIVFLIYRNWKISKNDIEKVNDLNRQVNLQKINLEKTLEKLENSSLEKDRILRTVTHDLRNPIGGIAALTRSMAEDDYTDEQKEWINLICETSQNSLELINEILEITNNESSPLKKQLVDINALLSRNIELLRFKAAEKNQQIKLSLLSIAIGILINREKISRIISNLISNAIKFSPENAEIFVKVLEFENEIEISVKDNGVGIPGNLHEKVFNMFTEAKRPGTAGEKSFGLGLSISKQIVESHGGKIWFESDGKTGTTFYARLPKS
ncbi:signal transduction histidine kinase [Mucilaginibacter frigoritolerans]|uniref:histidine kinase n=1 Tax=Mucilaginibacter frigoritolerans TaxID=652788 RepID=A0A562TYN0_9SPHI|nr:tetratricopeptide repeat-containing sensor histidine kinase [Mucilaginibacter frigoritolerans]TWI98234.1 signal transduction histidine kinase [Mucilaginibacter frigoritolerans]